MKARKKTKHIVRRTTLWFDDLERWAFRTGIPTEGIGAAMLLWSRANDNQGRLPTDEDTLRRWARVTPEAWADFGSILLEGWTRETDDDGAEWFVVRRIRETLEDQRAQSAQAKDAVRARKDRKPKAKTKNASPSPEETPINDRTTAVQQSKAESGSSDAASDVRSKNVGVSDVLPSSSFSSSSSDSLTNSSSSSGSPPGSSSASAPVSSTAPAPARANSASAPPGAGRAARNGRSSLADQLESRAWSHRTEFVAMVEQIAKRHHERSDYERAADWIREVWDTNPHWSVMQAIARAVLRVPAKGGESLVEIAAQARTAAEESLKGKETGAGAIAAPGTNGAAQPATQEETRCAI